MSDKQLPYCVDCMLEFNPCTLACPKCDSNKFFICEYCAKPVPISEVEKVDKLYHKFLVYMRGGWKCVWCEKIVTGFSSVTSETVKDYKLREEGQKYSWELRGFKRHCFLFKECVSKVFGFLICGLLICSFGYLFLKLLAISLRWILKNF